MKIIIFWSNACAPSNNSTNNVEEIPFFSLSNVIWNIFSNRLNKYKLTIVIKNTSEILVIVFEWIAVGEKGGVNTRCFSMCSQIGKKQIKMQYHAQWINKFYRKIWIWVFHFYWWKKYIWRNIWYNKLSGELNITVSFLSFVFF